MTLLSSAQHCSFELHGTGPLGTGAGAGGGACVGCAVGASLPCGGEHTFEARISYVVPLIHGRSLQWHNLSQPRRRMQRPYVNEYWHMVNSVVPAGHSG